MLFRFSWVLLCGCNNTPTVVIFSFNVYLLHHVWQRERSSASGGWGTSALATPPRRPSSTGILQQERHGIGRQTYKSTTPITTQCYTP